MFGMVAIETERGSIGEYGDKASIARDPSPAFY